MKIGVSYHLSKKKSLTLKVYIEVCNFRILVLKVVERVFKPDNIDIYDSFVVWVSTRSKQLLYCSIEVSPCDDTGTRKDV
jgi:hypothetical protein